MRGFFEVGRGNKKFYEFLFFFFLENDFFSFIVKDLFEFFWCFFEVGVDLGILFDVLENEILNKEKEFFS